MFRFGGAIVVVLLVGGAASAFAADKPQSPEQPVASTTPDRPLFVAVGYSLRRLISADGVRWEHEQASPELGASKNFLLRGVAGGQGKIVAVGGSSTSRILVSDTRGRDWRDVSVEHNWLGDVAFGNDRFVAVGYRRALHSPDGVTWSQPIVLPQASWRRIAFGNGRFVAVGAAGTTDDAPGFYAVTTDGDRWTVGQSADAAIPRSVTFGNGRFVAVGSRGLRETSTDGVAWTNRTLGDADETLVNVLWTGREFVAWGTRIAYDSPDGVHWAKSSRRMPSQAAFGAGKFVGCSAGKFSYSVDGRTWQPSPTEHKLSITEILVVPQP